MADEDEDDVDPNIRVMCDRNGLLIDVDDRVMIPCVIKKVIIKTISPKANEPEFETVELELESVYAGKSDACKVLIADINSTVLLRANPGDPMDVEGWEWPEDDESNNGSEEDELEGPDEDEDEDTRG